MDSSNPAKAFFAEEKLTDSEAEAVLLALGPRLEWASCDSSLVTDTLWQDFASVAATLPSTHHAAPVITWHRDIKKTVAFSVVTNGYYSIRASRRFWVFRIYTAYFLFDAPQKVEQHPRVFKSQDAAKAACEVHALTGQFPPSVQP